LLVEALYAHVAQKVSTEMAAVLACGPGARLSHGSAAALWGLLAWGGEIDIVVPGRRASRRPGICVHRRFDLETANRCEVHGIPVTDPITTLIDVTTCKTHEQVERAIREADRLDLERRFLRLIRKVDLPAPKTQVWLNGYRVDFTGLISVWWLRQTAFDITVRPLSRNKTEFEIRLTRWPVLRSCTSPLLRFASNRRRCWQR